MSVHIKDSFCTHLRDIFTFSSQKVCTTHDLAKLLCNLKHFHLLYIGQKKDVCVSCFIPKITRVGRSVLKPFFKFKILSILF